MGQGRAAHLKIGLQGHPEVEQAVKEQDQY